LANRGAGCDERSNTPGQFVLAAVENTIAEEKADRSKVRTA
jgi:hypothetical protein